MNRTFKFFILSPGGKTFEGEVEHVAAPGVFGGFGVLPGHAPMIAAVQPGLCAVRTSAGERNFYTGEGILEVSRQEVAMLVDEAGELQEMSELKSRLAERNKQAAGGTRR